jgi:uncharacterized protein (DUF1810 family)
MAGDPFNLQRFVDAQAGGVYEQALSEIKAGEKRSHWMWFIFPQSAKLGRSATAKFYGLSGPEEVRAYLAHPVLGPRYRECVAAVRAQVNAGPSTSSGQARLKTIFGELDAMKFRSSVEIFGPSLNPASSRRRSSSAGSSLRRRANQR